jgi:hypothetical protein
VKVGFADVVASVSLLISLVLIVWEVRRRLFKLHFKVIGISPIGEWVVNVRYLLLDLAFYNPSTITRTVYQIQFQPLEGFRLDEVAGVPDFSKALVSFQSPAGGGVQVRSEDTASFPLDVEPLHSKTVFLAVAVTIESPKSLLVSKEKNLNFGYIVALDPNQKKIAKVCLGL